MVSSSPGRIRRMSGGGKESKGPSQLEAASSPVRHIQTAGQGERKARATSNTTAAKVRQSRMVGWWSRQEIPSEVLIPWA